MDMGLVFLFFSEYRKKIEQQQQLNFQFDNLYLSRKHSFLFVFLYMFLQHEDDIIIRLVCLFGAMINLNCVCEVSFFFFEIVILVNCEFVFV